KIVKERKDIDESAGGHFLRFCPIRGLLRLCEQRQAERDSLFIPFRKTLANLRSSGAFDAPWATAPRSTREPVGGQAIREKVNEKDPAINELNGDAETSGRANRTRSRAHTVPAQSGVRNGRGSSQSQRRPAGSGTGDRPNQGEADTRTVERS